MIVDEKGLLRAMREAYKSQGYTVAAEERFDIENVIITNYDWTVIIRREELPRKILGMIAEHVGEIPQPGTAYKVGKKEVQTAIFEDVTDSLPKTQGRTVQNLRKTALSLAGVQLWQATEQNCMVAVTPENEDIIDWKGLSLVRLIGGDLLMVDDDTNRVLIRCEEPDTEREKEWLEHLEKIRWVAQ